MRVLAIMSCLALVGCEQGSRYTYQDYVGMDRRGETIDCHAMTTEPLYFIDSKYVFEKVMRTLGVASTQSFGDAFIVRPYAFSQCRTEIAPEIDSLCQSLVKRQGIYLESSDEFNELCREQLDSYKESLNESAYQIHGGLLTFNDYSVSVPISTIKTIEHDNVSEMYTLWVNDNTDWALYFRTESALNAALVEIGDALMNLNYSSNTISSDTK